MANPQLENGFLQLAKELLEAFARFDFTARQRAIIDVLLRKTWAEPDRGADGKVKRDSHGDPIKLKSAWISLSEFSRLSGIAERHVSAVLRELLHKRVITRSYPDQDRRPHFGFQKDYDRWQIPARTSRPLESTTLPQPTHTPADGSLPLVGVPADGSVTTPSKGILTPTDGSPTTPPAGDIKQENRRRRISKGKDTAAVTFPKPPSDHQLAIEFWCTEYETAIGWKYAFDRGKDGKIIKVLLKAFGLHNLRQIMLELIRTDNKWLRDERGISLSTLKSEANALAQKVFGTNHVRTRTPGRVSSDELRKYESIPEL